MPDIWTGSFDRLGASPSLRISVSGTAPEPGEFDAIVDTGFTGFLLMPLLHGMPLGLTPIGTTSVVLADGSVQPRLTAEGAITVQGVRQSGVVILDAGATELLIGMDFLLRFGRALVVVPTRDRVWLLDDRALERLGLEP